MPQIDFFAFCGSNRLSNFDDQMLYALSFVVSFSIHRILSYSEIENEMKVIWQFRYSSFMGRFGKRRKEALQKLKGEEESRYQKLDRQIGDFLGIGLGPSIVDFTLIFILGWVAITIREHVLTFYP